MIIHTGNRTDIPAFYSDWFAGRLKEGMVCVRNPFNYRSITKYILDPEIVDLIVFCTKNPEPMLTYMDLLNPYHQYWFVTITPYGKDIEPNVPDKSAVMDSFIRLSSVVGPEHTCWRYDPIFIDDRWTVERHIETFRSMCETLAGSTDTVVISFIDLYEKVRKNFPEVRTVDFPTQMKLTQAFVEIAGKYKMTIKPCGESIKLKKAGADCTGCMTQKTFEKAIGQNMILPANPKNRRECACYITGDIGAYNSCGHFCRYCYANADRAAVVQSMKQHDPASPLLIGHIEPEDKISHPKQVSYIDYQMRLDFS